MSIEPQWVELMMADSGDHGALHVQPRCVSAFGVFYDPVYTSDANGFVIVEGKQFPVMQTIHELRKLLQTQESPR